ncbi:MAG: hypothetical protein PHY45_02340 [Rhodocyclaceae bacterium]|nr:hypothetical protein [Rhodocyclaceae bacterium]
MQIDGHHTGTYVAARIAGFDHAAAEIVGYAAQYVDDATNEGVIQFSDSAYLYARIASAHSMIDYNNLVDVKNHLAWIPFHFLPGNGLLPAGLQPPGGEAAKLACRPDSPVARDMLRLALRDKDKRRGLHRLGIAMHVYADTFAHQGFIGALSAANRADAVTSGDAELDQRIRDATRTELLAGLWQGAKAGLQLAATSLAMAWRERKSPLAYWRDFVSDDPLGHAAVDTFPDQPFLAWRYVDANGMLVRRDNPAVFMHAFDMMTKAMRAWRAGDASMDLDRYPGLNSADRAAMAKLVRNLTDPRGEVRHAQWCQAIAAGVFSFGPTPLGYRPKGMGSWKEAALGTTRAEDTGFEAYAYSPDFLGSHWKQFHDALQAHRGDIVHEVLPRYGICAA